MSWVLISLFALELVGCSGSDSGGDSDSDSNAGGVSPRRYVAQICAAQARLDQQLESRTGLLEVLGSQTPPPKAKRQVVAWLAALDDGVEHMLVIVRDTGPPDVARGKQLHAQQLKALQQARAQTKKLEQRARDLPTGDREQFGAGLQRLTRKVSMSLNRLGDKFTQVDSKQLKAAMRAEPRCGGES